MSLPIDFQLWTVTEFRRGNYAAEVLSLFLFIDRFFIDFDANFVRVVLYRWSPGWLAPSPTRGLSQGRPSKAYNAAQMIIVSHPLFPNPDSYFSEEF